MASTTYHGISRRVEEFGREFGLRSDCSLTQQIPIAITRVASPNKMVELSTGHG